MRLIDCGSEHCETIRAIFNEAIAHSTAVYDYQPRTPRMIDDWFEAKRQRGIPVIGALSESDELLGFASYGPFRPWPAYKYTVEHSLYVATPHRGRGIGTQLLEATIARVRSQDCHALVGGIDSKNTASIRLHERFGFKHVATLPQVGFKFGNWLDLCFYQLLLDTPAEPVDG